MWFANGFCYANAGNNSKTQLWTSSDAAIRKRNLAIKRKLTDYDVVWKPVASVWHVFVGIPVCSYVSRIKVPLLYYNSHIYGVFSQPDYVLERVISIINISHMIWYMKR